MKAALFDLDGTLLDSLGVWADIDRAFLAQRGFEIPADYVSSIRGLSFLQTAQYTKERFHLKESAGRIAEIWHEMCREAYTHRVKLKPGAKEYLQKLKSLGTGLAVVTTLTEQLYEPVLKRNGVYSLFDVFATTDETGLDKKSGAVYLLAANRMGAEPEDCTVYEDITEGLLGAKAAGMKAVLVYDSHNRDSLDENRSLADDYIQSYLDII